MARGCTRSPSMPRSRTGFQDLDASLVRARPEGDQDLGLARSNWAMWRFSSLRILPLNRQRSMYPSSKASTSCISHRSRRARRRSRRSPPHPEAPPECRERRSRNRRNPRPSIANLGLLFSPWDDPPYATLSTRFCGPRARISSVKSWTTSAKRSPSDADTHPAAPERVDAALLEDGLQHWNPTHRLVVALVVVAVSGVAAEYQDAIRPIS